MKLILERHAYAPELNRAHIVRKGKPVATIRAPHCQSIREIRAKTFRRYGPVIRVKITKTYPKPWTHLNREYDALTNTRQQALELMQGQRAYQHSEPVTLSDGRVLPVPEFTIRTKLVN